MIACNKEQLQLQHKWKHITNVEPDGTITEQPGTLTVEFSASTMTWVDSNDPAAITTFNQSYTLQGNKLTFLQAGQLITVTITTLTDNSLVMTYSDKSASTFTR